MKSDEIGCQRTIISGVIWIFSGIINVIVFRLFSDPYRIIFSPLYLLAPALSLFLSSRWMIFGDAWKLLKSIFNKKEYHIVNDEDDYRPKKYGRSAIYITILVFCILGVITGIFAKSFLNQFLLSLILGVIWGVLWYFSFQNKYFHHEEFD